MVKKKRKSLYVVVFVPFFMGDERFRSHLKTKERREAHPFFYRIHQGDETGLKENVSIQKFFLLFFLPLYMYDPITKKKETTKGNKALALHLWKSCIVNLLSFVFSLLTI